MAGSEGNPKTEKKLLENPLVGSLVVPIAIVLVGALIIFGVTAMLSTDRSYKDLVREMQSKTFGNRWIAAYELSKFIASSSIPEEDIPWLSAQLTDVYTDSVDPRTREFVIVALGALNHSTTIPVLEKSLDDPAGNVRFHALVALGNLPQGSQVDWNKVGTFLTHEDHGLRHAAVLSLAHHRIGSAQNAIITRLNDDVASVRYAAAMGLIYFKNEEAVPVLEEILTYEPAPVEAGLDEAQMVELQINIMDLIAREKWILLSPLLNDVISRAQNQRIVVKAQEVLNLLKN